MNRYIVTAVLVAALAGSALWAVGISSPQPTSQQDCATAGHAEDHKTANDAFQKVTSKVLSPEQQVALYTRELAWFTAGLFVATILLFVASVVQGCFIAWGNKTARIAADAARDSADASVAASRAYLFPSVNDTRQDFAVNFTTTHRPLYEVQFRLVNYGNTPAVIKRIDATVYCGNRPRGSIPTMQRTKGLFGSVVLPNEQSAYAIAKFPISQEQKEAILAETSEIFLVAIVVFEDVFEWHHRTLFCLRFDSSRGWVIYNSSRMNRRLKSFPPGAKWTVRTDTD